MGVRAPACGMTDVADLTLREAASAVRDRRLGPLELVDAAVARIEAIDPAIDAWASLDIEGARRQARALRPGSGTEQPLLGVPIGVKDNIDVRGLVTGNGSRIHDPLPAAADAAAVAALRRAGAVVLGKTRTTEFATGAAGAPTRNPWGTDRVPGGSSAGSAAAVATGMCATALGTDTAGSIRIPAALCGVAGLKPRRDAVSLAGTTPLSPTLDSIGPIARDARDLELAWRALTGAPAIEALRAPVVGAPLDPSEIAPVEPAVAALFQTALAALVADDGRIERLTLSATASHERDRILRLLAEAHAVHAERGWFPDRVEEYEPDTRRQLEFGARVGAAELVRAEWRLRAGLEREYREALERVDVIALPTTAVAAPPADEAPSDRGERRPPPADEAPSNGGKRRPPLTRVLTAFCGQVNWCGLAAVSVPCGLTPEGLPAGLQLIARDEATALAAALRFEHLTGPPARVPLAALTAHDRTRTRETP